MSLAFLHNNRAKFPKDVFSFVQLPNMAVMISGASQGHPTPPPQPPRISDLMTSLANPLCVFSCRNLGTFASSLNGIKVMYGIMNRQSILRSLSRGVGGRGDGGLHNKLNEIN